MSKSLVRSTTDKYLAGVCGGIASYFNIDPTIVRIVMVLAAVFLQPIGLFIYPALWLLLPAADGGPSGMHQVRKLFDSSELR